MENTRKKNGKTSTDMFRHMRSVQSYTLRIVLTGYQATGTGTGTGTGT